MSDRDGILQALLGCSSILISVHKNPDGDALGSQLALMLALEQKGKTVSVHNLDPVPELYAFLPHADRITIGPKVQGAYDGAARIFRRPDRVAPPL